MQATVAEDLNIMRIGIFVATLMLMMGLERLLPRRKLDYSVLLRWRTNLSMIVIDTAVVRLLVPMTTVGIAAIASDRGWGLLHIVNWPMLVETVFAVLLLDFAIYLQHVASHRFSVLWKIHQVHHSDPDIDTTTGIRFHPAEIVLSMLYKFFLIFLLGPSVFAVVFFEIVLNTTAVFNHANFRIPSALDRIIRLLVVTPDVHRIHHSVIRQERDSNYGFNLTIWDRLCRTWTEQPEHGHTEMEIGMKAHRGNEPIQLRWSLLLPFRRKNWKK